ncbi:PREDICTED: L-type lectin-domain containing receptor kinase IX 1 [Prunus dulcis]|uniref:PREDICTED: L-type lectin-domain containing receptor kinase IX 1 n=1 Tax=Prunus dulcis TaxID=3755 RepID=A0A5E4EPW9_PRUDU|nr:PREDICTED: L-type lectin-domain containing receptor kinase IX 1 [Prunus dulcis]
MVFNNYGKGIIPLHSPKLMFLLLLFFLFNPSATPLTFNFPSFSNVTTNIYLEGVADIDSNLIRLTTNPEETGNVVRATYHEPFVLRENATRKFADFTTNFTFKIDNGHADGMPMGWCSS